jgi:hypothetical protein
MIEDSRGQWEYTLPPNSYTFGRFTMISPHDLIYPDDEEGTQE